MSDAERFRCAGCHQLCPRRAVDQRYCSRPPCQKARKNEWRRRKYATDPDYRANLRDSTRAWLVEQGGAAAYYREYRATHRPPGVARKLNAPSVSTLIDATNATSVTDAELIAPVSSGPLHPPVAAARTERAPPTGAKSDAPLPEFPVKSGRYRLLPVVGRTWAKSDAILVDLTILSKAYGVAAKIDSLSAPP